MDQKYVGKFIQSLRKEKGLTQKELAERICVSDKTISKWENGNSMPDTSMLMDLCNELDISVNELLSCERIPPEEYSKKAEVTIMNLMKENQENKKADKIKIIFGIVFLALALFLSTLGIGMNLAWFLDIPAFLILACGCIAVVLLNGGKPGKAETVRTLRKTVMPIGALIFFISMIAVLHGDTSQKLEPNLAVALLSIIYSTIAYIILFLLEKRWS